jgi:hypothetical protein
VRSLLFGGFDPTFGYLADTWIFSGNNWSQAAPATPPAARGLTMMAYDSTNARYLAFAGTNSFFTPWEDTWAYAAGQWTQLATQRSPSTRRGGGAAWFAPLNRFVIYSAEYLSQANLKSTAMWEFGQNLASFIRFGPSECPAIDPPVLRAYQSQPALGTTFEARVESFSCVINLAVLGLSDTTWAGGPAAVRPSSAVGTNPLCFLRVSTEVLATLGAGFSSSWFLPIPVSGSFLGFTMYVQGWTWGQGTFPTNLSAGNARDAGGRRELTPRHCAQRAAVEHGRQSMASLGEIRTREQDRATSRVAGIHHGDDCLPRHALLRSDDRRRLLVHSRLLELASQFDVAGRAHGELRPAELPLAFPLLVDDTHDDAKVPLGLRLDDPRTLVQRQRHGEPLLCGCRCRHDRELDLDRCRPSPPSRSVPARGRRAHAAPREATASHWRCSRDPEA